jgi:hypothetical protein
MGLAGLGGTDSEICSGLKDRQIHRVRPGSARTAAIADMVALTGNCPEVPISAIP